MIINGIPIWFRCFKGKNNPEALKTSLIKEGILYVQNLFKDKNCNIIFLADRWFSNLKIMKYIDDIEETYCIRTKSNTSVYIYNYKYIVGKLYEIEGKETENQYFDKVLITKKNYETKLAISKKENHEEVFYILTNGKVEEAIKNYSYRFGSIESIFKNQKTNGFYLESTKIRNIQAFKTMFGLMSIALLWLTLIGVEYSKEKRINKNEIKIKWYKKEREGIKRIISLFKTGLMYFNLIYNSNKKVRIKCDFKLYEM